MANALKSFIRAHHHHHRRLHHVVAEAEAEVVVVHARRVRYRNWMALSRVMLQPGGVTMVPTVIRIRVALISIFMLGSVTLVVQSLAGNQSEYRPARAIPRADGFSYSVNSGRPVTEIVQQISDRTGVVITYEDPPILFPGEIDDVTAEVARDPDAALVRNGRGVLVPKNKVLEWTEQTTSTVPTIGQVEVSLLDLLRVHNATDAGGKLKLVRDGDILHVVPTRTKLENGQWWDVFSVMDVPITVAPEQRSVDDQLDAIFHAIGKKLGVFIRIVRSPVNTIQVAASMYQLDGVTGRNAVMEVLQKTNTPTRWAILYDPSIEGYYVSFVRLPDKTPGDAGNVQPAAPERTNVGPTPSVRMTPPK